MKLAIILGSNGFSGQVSTQAQVAYDYALNFSSTPSLNNSVFRYRDLETQLALLTPTHYSSIDVFYLCNLCTYKQSDEQTKITADDVASNGLNTLGFLTMFETILNYSETHQIPLTWRHASSHICFIQNKGFALYRAHKKFQNDYLLSREFESKILTCKIFHFPAVDTYFALRSKYQGPKVTRPISPQRAAKEMIKRTKSQNIFGLKDQVLYCADKYTPSKMKPLLNEFIYLIARLLTKDD